MQQQEQPRFQAARSQSEVQALIQLIVEIADRGRGVVTSQRIRQPDLLRGTQEQVFKEWQAWSYMFVTWFSSQFTFGEDALDWPRVKLSRLETPKSQPSRACGWTDLSRMNAQLQVALVSLCREKALTMIRNSLKGQGVDAWSRLCKEYKLSNAQSNLGLLKRLLQPTSGESSHIGRKLRTRVPTVLQTAE